MPPQTTISRRELTTLALGTFQMFFLMNDYGRSCPAKLLRRLVLWAAVRGTTISSLFHCFTVGCGRETARKALHQQLDSWNDLDRQINQALVHHFPRRLKRRKLQLALDRHDHPYYGKVDPDDTTILPGPRTDGTNWFHAYATIYIIYRGQQFTLATMALETTHTWKEIVQELVRKVRRQGLKIGLLLLDRGFWSAEVVQYLKAAQVPFLMPAIGRGKTEHAPGGPTGTNQFFAWKQSGFSEYWLNGKKVSRRVKVQIAVCRFWVKSRRSGKRRMQKIVYAFWGISFRSTNQVKELYRRRFSIESSYRQGHQTRCRTTSLDRQQRYLWLGLSLLLRNLWVWLQSEVFGRWFHSQREEGPENVGYITLQRMWERELSLDWQERDEILVLKGRERVLRKPLKLLTS